MKRLRTLGGLELDGNAPNTTPLGLLLLAYVAVSGRTSRAEVAAIFWPDKSSHRRSRSLSELIRWTRRDGISRDLPGDGIACAVPVDALEVQRHLAAGRAEAAIAAYTGPFLDGAEYRSRLTTSEEIREWIVAHRADLALRIARAALRLGVDAARQGDFSRGAHWARRARNLAETISYPLPKELITMHALLLAAEEYDRADRVASEATELYGEVELRSGIRSARAWLRGGAAIPPLDGPTLGREHEVQRILALLERGERAVTITGPEGVGKTTIATEVAYRLHDPTENRALVRYVPLAGERFGRADLARRVVATTHERTNADWTEAVHLLADAPSLLVLDDVHPGIAGIVAALIHESGAQVLVTALRPLELPGECIVRLPPLSCGGPDAPATLLLQRTAERRGVPAADLDRDHLARIGRRLGGYPRALKAAAADIAAWGLTETLAATEGRPFRPDSSSMWISLDRTWKALREGERTTLSATCLWRGAASPWEISAVSQTSSEDVASLVTLGLLTPEAEGKVRVPRPLGDAVRRVSGVVTDHSAWRDAWVRVVLGRLEGVAHEARWSSDLSAAWRYAATNGRADDLIPLAHAWWRVCDEAGRTEEAADGLRLARDAATETQRDRLRAALAWCLVRAGRYCEALEEAAGPTEIDGSDLVGWRSRMQARGAALDSLGRHEEAVAVHRTALASAREDPGWAATALVNLAISIRKLGRVEEALELVEDARVRLERLGRSDRDPLLALVAGRCLHEAGRAREAHARWMVGERAAVRENQPRLRRLLRAELGDLDLDAERVEDARAWADAEDRDAAPEWRASATTEVTYVLFRARLAHAERTDDTWRAWMRRAFGIARRAASDEIRVRVLAGCLPLLKTNGMLEPSLVQTLELHGASLPPRLRERLVRAGAVPAGATPDASGFTEDAGRGRTELVAVLDVIEAETLQ